MSATYSCAVSTAPGAAPDDAKLHHVKDKSGRTVKFQNAYPSFGRWRDISLPRSLFIFFRYVSSLGASPVIRHYKVV